MPKRSIEQYDHKDKERVNNPPVGLVDDKNDPDGGKKVYAYDPHIDPALQFDSQRSEVERIIDDGLAADTTDPEEAVEALKTARKALLDLKKRQEPYLNWAGKAERTTFEVDTVSLHVHERIDPRTIIEAVRKKPEPNAQPSLFETPTENLPIRKAIEFYKHSHQWSNRLIAGDSLLVMNSLLEKEGLGGQVQMVYIDPPYGITYGSNFQPFINKREVKDGKDEDLTQEPEMLKAFRDTWELGIHSYMTYLRDRLWLTRELLSESGSVFVQISDGNIHRVRCIMDEVFGAGCFVALIAFATTTGQTSGFLANPTDYLLWYGRNREQLKFRRGFQMKQVLRDGGTGYRFALLPDGTTATLREEDLDDPGFDRRARPFMLGDMTSQRQGRPSGPGTAMHFAVEHDGRTFFPTGNRGWSTTAEGIPRLQKAGRCHASESLLLYVRFLDDFPCVPITADWRDTASGFMRDKMYVVQTNSKVIQRCMLLATDPGDLVFDPTCGSGTTAYVAEQWGRRWITCDSSRVSIALAKQRLMVQPFDYYELARPEEGVGSGFKYKTVPHITLKSIANNEEIDRIHERQHPAIETALKELNAVAGLSLEEWEVPFQIPEDWPEGTREPFERFRKLKREMQTKMDQSIQKNAEPETLYDQPIIEKSKLRVTGPFTLEAVPAPAVKALSEVGSPAPEGVEADQSVARSGETLRQAEWRDELLKTGIRGKGGQTIQFSRVEPIPGARWLHAEAETKEETPQKVVISFGPEHAPLEQRQVSLALDEFQNTWPKPKIVVFAAFQFDPEAAKDIDETKWTGVTLLKAQMSTDLLTEDLKKKRASNESFWLIGQPDVRLEQIKDGEHEGKYQVEVAGFDYYNTRTGQVESGGTERIAVWLLDTDYDGRSLFARQVFFPMAGEKDGWSKLAKTLKAEIDPELIEAYRGTLSLPFDPGDYRKVAVKIVDDRGIESLRIIEVE
ncbi:MAG: site-specific DNA-methyltransferase [Armatimonadetes bacterium]|nr:site-specific DNA-methyltransferase [Armatimonadota bacterium]